MFESSQSPRVLEIVSIGATYIAASGGLITFNKYILDESRFPHALHLTAFHMTMTTFYSLCLSTLFPSIYPSMQRSLEDKLTTLKYIAPLSLMFAFSLWASNQAYQYSSIAFLQFCKESNVATAFFLACIAGRQTFSWTKLAILGIIILGCSLCTEGEVNFAILGFVLQMSGQLAECSKNLIGEIVMSGMGLKLDPLTFVAWQAPCSLMPLIVAIAIMHEGVLANFMEHLPLLVADASLAFLLNVMIAVTLKRLSAVSFIMIAILKDIVIVCASAHLFGDPITTIQRIGFTITMIGIAAWGNKKMQDDADAACEMAPKEILKDEKMSECKEA